MFHAHVHRDTLLVSVTKANKLSFDLFPLYSSLTVSGDDLSIYFQESGQIWALSSRFSQ